jgi:predicted amidohydrolase YtcJ
LITADNMMRAAESQRPARTWPPPLAIVNGAVFTAAVGKRWAQAVGTQGGMITAVGSTREVLAALPHAEVIDVAGATVLPGLIDAHNHFLATGESLAAEDVRYPRVRSVDELAAAVAAAAAGQEPGSYVRAYGFDHAKYARAPTRWDLDRAAPGHPVIVGHVSGHYVLASSLAMQQQGVREDAADPPGGQLGRDEAGRLTGMFRDAAIGLIQPTAVDIGHHGPNFHVTAGLTDLVSAVERAGTAYLAAGLTAVCDAQVTSRELAAYQEARRLRRLPLRTVCMPLSHQLEQYEALGLRGPFGDDWLSIGPMKFYCDGSLIGGTAAFSTPYGTQGEFGGLLFWEAADFGAAIERAHRNGWQVGVHAQGDKAIGIVLDAFERAQRARRDDDPRFRIEHCGFPTLEQLARMRDLGVIAICQPSYLRDSGDEFLDRLPGRAHRLQPLRSALNLGIPVVLSSDSDVASYRPLDTIAAAVTRQTVSGRAIGADQAMTAVEAVLAHTIAAAHAIRADRRLGSLEVGKLADLVVLGGDLFACDPAEISDLGIRMTVIGGEVAFSSA